MRRSAVNFGLHHKWHDSPLPRAPVASTSACSGGLGEPLPVVRLLPPRLPADGDDGVGVQLGVACVVVPLAVQEVDAPPNA